MREADTFLKWPVERRIEVGQHMMVGFPEATLTPEIRTFLRDYRIGNIILFRRNVESEAQLARLCADLTACIEENTGHKPLISIDQEGGTVTRTGPDSLHIPGAMAMAAAGDPALTYEAGRMTGRQLRACGINIDLAPVMDINASKENPVVGVRSYGDTPAQVAAYGTAMLRGLQDEGVMACIKHFPGHGDTDKDSHTSLPRVEKSLEALEATDFYPFQQAITAGAAAVMSAHILFPVLEPDGVPGTMSRRILTDLLREKMGFQGLVITDCMEMAAIATYYGTETGAVAALRAGADIVLISHTVEVAKAAMERIAEALEGGELSAEALAVSTRRILAAKEKLAAWGGAGAGAAAAPDTGADSCAGLDGTKTGIYPEREADMAAGVSMMEHSVTSYRLPDGKPPELGARPLFASGFVTRTSQVNNEITKRLSLAQSMEEAGLGDGYTFSSDPTDEEIDGLLEALNSHTSLVLGTYNGHVKPGMRKLFARLEPASQKMPMLAVSFALPYDLADMPAGVPGLAVWEYTEETVDLVARFLRGELVPQGRMPVTL